MRRDPASTVRVRKAVPAPAEAKLPAPAVQPRQETEEEDEPDPRFLPPPPPPVAPGPAAAPREPGAPPPLPRAGYVPPVPAPAAPAPAPTASDVAALDPLGRARARQLDLDETKLEEQIVLHTPNVVRVVGWVSIAIGGFMALLTVVDAASGGPKDVAAALTLVASLAQAGIGIGVLRGARSCWFLATFFYMWNIAGIITMGFWTTMLGMEPDIDRTTITRTLAAMFVLLKLYSDEVAVFFENIKLRRTRHFLLQAGIVAILSMGVNGAYWSMRSENEKRWGNPEEEYSDPDLEEAMEFLDESFRALEGQTMDSLSHEEIDAQMAPPDQEKATE